MKRSAIFVKKNEKKIIKKYVAEIKVKDDLQAGLSIFGDCITTFSPRTYFLFFILSKTVSKIGDSKFSILIATRGGANKIKSHENISKKVSGATRLFLLSKFVEVRTVFTLELTDAYFLKNYVIFHKSNIPSIIINLM